MFFLTSFKLAGRGVEQNSVTYGFEHVWTATAQFRRIESRQRYGSKIRSGYVTRQEADHLLASDLDAAESRARLALRWHCDNSMASYLLGAALQRTGRLQEAREVLEPLTQSQPKFSAAWSELGLVLQKLGEVANATNANLRAIGFDPLDQEAWYALGDLIRFPDDDGSGAGRDADHSLLEEAAIALGDERFEQAESILRELIETRPADAKAHQLLADILICTDRWIDAKPLLEKSLELAPQLLKARFRYGAMLTANKEFQAALPHIEVLLESAPGNFLYHHLRAIALGGAGDFERAILEFERLTKSSPDRPGLWLQHAQILRTHRPEKAAALLDKVLQRFPFLVEASYILATIKSFRFDQSWVERIRMQFDDPGLDIESRAKLHFILGKAFEDMGDYAKSFDHYKSSNDIQCEIGQAGLKNAEQFIRVAKTVFTRHFVEQRRGVGYKDFGPIFVVGLPRSGSTLVEQMLSSHSAIEGLGEVVDMLSIIKQLGPTPFAYPRFLKTADYDRFRALGEEYMALTRARRKTGKPFFTDKLPMNYAHAILIHLMLPNARIVDVRRHPLDCGFSCYKHYFPAGQDRTLGRRRMGRWYADYVELMAHFDEILPGRIHRIIYEDLIESPEEEVRRLLDYLGLPFEEECLRFYETERVVDTISAEQVRMPLYKSGVAHWRHYERWLDPMKEELGNVLDMYPAPPEFFARLRTRVAPRPTSTPRFYRQVRGTRQLPFEFVPLLSGRQNNPC
jgi:tetratricopeptide (TPR) repeat protein